MCDLCHSVWSLSRFLPRSFCMQYSVYCWRSRIMCGGLLYSPPIQCRPEIFQEVLGEDAARACSWSNTRWQDVQDLQDDDASN